jgi:histidine ammonia-lyase
MPQVHGAARQALRFVREVIEVECNSATDNPLLFPEAGLILSGGNFHGQPVAQVLDFLAIACADLGAISERRIARLVDPALWLMMAQIVAAALVADLRLQAHPASVDSIPTDNNKEDHVSMGVGAGLKAAQAVELLEQILALELICAAQAIEFLRPLRAGTGVEQAYDVLRAEVAPLEQDRVLHEDIVRAAALVQSGAFARIARGHGA